MKIELQRTDRISFPTGILDLALSADESTAYAACMDGIYQLRLPKAEPATDGEPTAENKTETKAEGETKAEPKPAAAPKPKPRRIGRHASYVSGIALGSGDATLLSTAYDGSLHIRDLARPAPESSNDDANDEADKAADASAAGESAEGASEVEPRFAERVHPFWSWGLAISPDKRWIASVTGQYLAGSEDYTPLASEEPTVKIFDANTGKLVHGLDMLPSVQCVAFDPSSRYVAAGNLMGDLAVWDAASGQRLAQWRTNAFTSWGIIKSHCYIGGVFAVSFSPDGESLYAAGMGEMRDPMAGNGKQLWQRFAWRKEPVEKIQETVADQAGEGLMETLAWHPDGELFVMGGRLRGGNWNLGIFARESGQLVGQAKTGMRITTARFSSDGQTLLLAGLQGQPGPKENRFPDFGYLERYRVVRS